jgi:hypothetical protein
LAEQEKGGFILPDDLDDKSGEQVIYFLLAKHPDTQVPEASNLEEYESVPGFVELDITEEVVEKVA